MQLMHNERKTFVILTWQALMLLMSWGTPWDESVPSFSRITGVGWKRTKGIKRLICFELLILVREKQQAL